MSSTMRDSRWCIECAAEQWFEVPPCEDGHGLDCLDLACVECGAAIMVGLQMVVLEASQLDRAAA